jgi:wyosine [tRNA(Phe)-imidazoG37] synthetase (radical SAM superfamily)
MNHIFGPVNSRRLGRSLGIDLFPKKICNLNCIYCEVGATTNLTCERGEYIPTADIIAEIDAWCHLQERVDELDFVTVTASGEPTLHTGFGTILAHLKEVTAKPVAVLTNGTTLSDSEVCQETAQADVVIPSLDSALTGSFRKIDRPAKCLDLARIIEGLVSFSHQYHGKIWLEILFAQNINDSDQDIEALAKVLKRMRLDRIQLNTVIRPPLESFARPIEQKRMQAIADRFQQDNPDCPIDLLAGGAVQEDDQPEKEQKIFNLEQKSDRSALRLEVVEMLKRRPCTAADINRIFHLGGTEKVEQLLDSLVQSNTIQKRIHEDRLYYHS